MSDLEATYRHQQLRAVDSGPSRQSLMFSENVGLAVHGKTGSVTTELWTLGATGVSIGRVVSTGHEIEVRETDTLIFLLPQAGRLDIQILDQSYRLLAGGLMAFRPTRRRTRASADRTGRFHAVTLQVPKRHLPELERHAGVAPDRAFARDAVTLHSNVGPRLASILPQLADSLFLRPASGLPPRVALAIGHLVDELLCDMIDRHAEGFPLRRVFPAFHRVRQAEEIMHEHSDDPLSMLEIAQRLGVSLRSLQLAFNEVYDGQSPRDILNQIRLAKVRQRLLSAANDGRVTTVALDSGFFHLSRFAQAYARTYGERPSETLARHRA